jgi:hypothetical protein
VAVYLGDSGFVELKRDALGAALRTHLDPSDVNVGRKRFSVDFASGSLLTGDRIEIATVDGSPLELVAGHVFPDGRWYVHVDAAGGLRLYSTFEAALSGQEVDALALTLPSAAKHVTVHTRNSRFRCLARIKDFEITTSRETVDTTLLGAEFRQQYEAGLISGQGSMNAFWEHAYALCDPDYRPNAPEFPVYLAQLVVRIQQGADFMGRFFVYHDADSSDGLSNSVWYEADCVVTNVAVTVAATQVIETRIEFVTSGPITLRMGRPPSYLLQESGDQLLQEDGSGIFLEGGA